MIHNYEKFEIFSEFIGNVNQKEKTFPYLKYTEYTIKIYTKNKSWLIKKRYKEFSILNERLKLLIGKLPFFPQKRLFCMKDLIVNERIILLENYLNEALKLVNLQIFSKKFEFLSVFISLNSLKSINNELTFHEKNKVQILRTESTVLETFTTASNKYKDL